MLPEKSLSVVVALVPWVIFIANNKFLQGKRKFFSIIASIVFVYVALLLQVHLMDIRLEKELYAFDLNGDGVFSGIEIRPDQEAAMSSFVNDTGRAMAPVTGAIFSILYSFAAFILVFSASWLWSKYRGKRI